jgi:hypothetical protein
LDPASNRPYYLNTATGLPIWDFQHLSSEFFSVQCLYMFFEHLFTSRHASISYVILSCCRSIAVEYGCFE